MYQSLRKASDFQFFKQQGEHGNKLLGQNES